MTEFEMETILNEVFDKVFPETDGIIEWADKEREKIEGVGLSDGLVNIITQVIERKMNERFR